MKRLKYLLVLIPILLLAVVVKASTPGTATVTVQDTTGAARQGISAIVPFPVAGFISQGWMASSGNDTSLVLGSTPAPYLLADSNNLTVGVDSLLAYQQNQYTFSTGLTANATPFSIVTGPGGYVTTTEAPNLKSSSNFSLSSNSVYIGNTGNITRKPGQLLLSTSNTTVTGNVTSSAYPTLTATQPDVSSGFAFQWYDVYSGVSRSVGQFIPNLAAGNITSASIWIWRRTGGPFPASTANVTVRRASDLVSLGILGTIDPSTIAGDGSFSQGEGAWYTFSNPVVNPVEQDVVVNIELTDLAAEMPAFPIYLLFPYPNTDTIYGDGALGVTGTSYSLSGDGGFRMTFTANSTGEDYIVTTSGVVAGDSINLINRDGGLELRINNSIQDSVFGVNMTSSADTWSWLENIPYAANITYSVNGTQRLYYSPSSIIVGNNLPDRSPDATSNNGTITWGTNSGLSVNVSGIQSSTSYIPSANGTTTLPELLTLPPPLASENTTENTSMPWYDLFLPAAKGTVVYSVGTASGNSGDYTINGTGTAWTSDMAGDTLIVDGNIYIVGSVASPTLIILTTPLVTTFALVAYTIRTHSLGWSTNILYGVMMLFVAVLIGTGVLVATGSTLLATIACGIAIAMGASTGMLGWWTLLAFIIFASGYFMVSKQF